VGALPDPRPCAAVVTPNAVTATAVTARSESLRMVWNPSGHLQFQEECPRKATWKGRYHNYLADLHTKAIDGCRSKARLRFQN
jgi:hypothetical protein